MKKFKCTIRFVNPTTVVRVKIDLGTVPYAVIPVNKDEVWKDIILHQRHEKDDEQFFSNDYFSHATMNSTSYVVEDIEEIDADNPFKLFHGKAERITLTIKELINNLARDIIDLEVTSEYDNLLPAVADKIKIFYSRGVGLSDTASREAMADYLEEKLAMAFDAVDYTQMRQDFYMHL